MCEPTARQQQILDILLEYNAAGRPCPTQDEIAAMLGISQPAVAGHLAALDRKGFITRDPAAHRSIGVVMKRQSNASEETTAML